MGWFLLICLVILCLGLVVGTVADEFHWFL